MCLDKSGIMYWKSFYNAVSSFSGFKIITLNIKSLCERKHAKVLQEDVPVTQIQQERNVSTNNWQHATEVQQQPTLFYSHYTGQPALAGTSS